MMNFDKSKKYVNALCYTARLWQNWFCLLDQQKKFKFCLAFVSLLASFKVCQHLFLIKLWNFLRRYFTYFSKPLCKSMTSFLSLKSSRQLPVSNHQLEDVPSIWNNTISFDSIQMNNQDMASMFKKMLCHRNFSETTEGSSTSAEVFLISNPSRRKFVVHQCVLSCFAPKIHQLFALGAIEVELNVDATALSKFVNYMYHGVVHFTNIHELDALLAMALKYELVEMTKQCIDSVEKASLLDVRVACELLLIVERNRVVLSDYGITSESGLPEIREETREAYLRAQNLVDWDGIRERCINQICNHFVTLTKHSISCSLIGNKKKYFLSEQVQMVGQEESRVVFKTSFDFTDEKLKAKNETNITNGEETHNIYGGNDDPFLKLPLYLLLEIIQSPEIKSSQAIILLSILAWIEHDIKDVNIFDDLCSSNVQLSSSNQSFNHDVHEDTSETAASKVTCPITPPSRVKLSESLKTLTPIASNQFCYNELNDIVEMDLYSERMFSQCEQLFRCVRFELIPTDFMVSIIEPHPYVSAYSCKFGNITANAYRKQALLAQQYTNKTSMHTNNIFLSDVTDKTNFPPEQVSTQSQSLPRYIVEIIHDCIDLPTLVEKEKLLNPINGINNSIEELKDQTFSYDVSDNLSCDEGMTSTEASDLTSKTSVSFSLARHYDFKETLSLGVEGVMTTPVRNQGTSREFGSWTPPPPSSDTVSC